MIHSLFSSPLRNISSAACLMSCHETSPPLASLAIRVSGVSSTKARKAWGEFPIGSIKHRLGGSQRMDYLASCHLAFRADIDVEQPAVEGVDCRLIDLAHR